MNLIMFLLSSLYEGLKNIYEGEGVVPPFFAAACELVLGLLPIVGKGLYRFCIFFN